jgi:hypothetical protein
MADADYNAEEAAGTNPPLGLEPLRIAFPRQQCKHLDNG